MIWIYSMKERFIHITLFAIALLTACERTALGPDSTGKDNAISLALSLKYTGNVPADQTKMSSDITQDGSGFRGIEQVYVVPFQTESASPVEVGNARLGNRNVLIQNPTIGQYGLIANNNSHLYSIVLVPMMTNRVLAYGKAFDSGSVSTKEGKHLNGVLTPTGLDNPNTPGDISFSLENILAADEAETISQTADNLIASFNDLIEVIQSSKDAGILEFLDAFTFENQILACSSATVHFLEQSFFDAIYNYSGNHPENITPLLSKITALEAAREAAGSNFPASYGIPEGSVGMWWNGHKYVKIISGVNISLVPEGQYCYPPSLWYYANSTVRTSDDDTVEEQYKSQNLTWGSILSRYSDGPSVVSSTRSVAIVDQMEYGVGLVEFHLLAQGNATAAAGCPLTGIIIGDQKDVDYSFAPKSSESLFLYDNSIDGITLSGTSQSFQTLVLPTSAGQAVHFALEFQNNTTSSFPCQQGTIQPGCKFYLAGELKPEAGQKPDAGYSAGIFDSDHKTTINLRVKDLGNAYNAVPDLRAPQLELGVVAEMDWIQLDPGGVKLPF